MRSCDAAGAVSPGVWAEVLAAKHGGFAERGRGSPALSAILEALQRTDELIDLVVYRRYGLTEEEVAVVEGRTEAP